MLTKNNRQNLRFQGFTNTPNLWENNKPIHLEIIYKFYLYDPSIGLTQLDHWIGPNRRDSLVKKLTKLKQKQLPLLYHPLITQLLISRL